MRPFLAVGAVLLAVGCSTETGEMVQPARVAPIAALGRMLFFDRGLSADGQVSCASCHQPERAYADGLDAMSQSARQGWVVFERRPSSSRCTRGARATIGRRF